jgi:hypothetical protein
MKKYKEKKGDPYKNVQKKRKRYTRGGEGKKGK